MCDHSAIARMEPWLWLPVPGPLRHDSSKHAKFQAYVNIINIYMSCCELQEICDFFRGFWRQSFLIVYLFIL